MDGIKKLKYNVNVNQGQKNAPIATSIRRTHAKRREDTRSEKTKNGANTGTTKVVTSLKEGAKRARAKGKRGEERGVAEGEMNG